MKKFLVLVSFCLLLFLGGCAESTEEYIVVYDLNGGSLISGKTIQRVELGGSATPPTVERDGYTLSWNLESDNIAHDAVISAIWTPNTYSVIFNLNGGELVSGKTAQTVEAGKGAEAPRVTKNGMTLSWDKDFSCVTKHITVNAVWEKRTMDSVEIAEYALERTVVIKCDEEAVGTGFFINGNGTFVTNFHVIEGVEEIEIELHNGSTYEVKEVVGFLPYLDLAVLKVNYNSPYFEINKTNASVGECVYTMGTALGFLDSTFTSGVISSNSRKVGKIECYQMDTPISSGNSGGPLINQYGEVVGVTSFSYIYGNALNLAIKISQLDKITPKNMTLREYKEWYVVETGHSYSPQRYNEYFEEYEYYYSLINTYQYVTGEECKYSWDNNEETWLSGYHDCCNIYVYEYGANYDIYISYIKNLGFEYDSEQTLGNNLIITYYSELDEVYIDFMFYTEDNEVWIQVYY